jgi:hypothetical protein
MRSAINEQSTVKGRRPWSGVGSFIGAVGLAFLSLSASAAILTVPSPQYPPVKAAFTAARDGDIIEIASNPGLYLEAPPLLLSGSQHIILQLIWNAFLVWACSNIISGNCSIAIK